MALAHTRGVRVYLSSETGEFMVKRPDGTTDRLCGSVPGPPCPFCNHSHRDRRDRCANCGAPEGEMP